MEFSVEAALNVIPLVAEAAAGVDDDEIAMILGFDDRDPKFCRLINIDARQLWAACEASS